jgi:hypothetical protein
MASSYKNSNDFNKSRMCRLSCCLPSSSVGESAVLMSSSRKELYAGSVPLYKLGPFMKYVPWLAHDNPAGLQPFSCVSQDYCIGHVKVSLVSAKKEVHMYNIPMHGYCLLLFLPKPL